MSTPGPRASDLAAQQVEQIVAAAQRAAEEIHREARAEQKDLRRQAQLEGEEERERAQRAAQKLLEQARKQAVALGNDACHEAQNVLKDAREESARTREQTKRAVDGRVASAEKAAADVLEEARALSSGLRQLGRALEDHAERILRDVTVAHKQMQADMRVSAAPPEEPAGPVAAEADDGPRAARRLAPARKPPASPAGSRSPDRGGTSGGGPRPSPLDDLEVPSWVGERS